MYELLSFRISVTITGVYFNSPICQIEKENPGNSSPFDLMQNEGDWHRYKRFNFCFPHGLSSVNWKSLGGKDSPPNSLYICWKGTRHWNKHNNAICVWKSVGNRGKIQRGSPQRISSWLRLRCSFCLLYAFFNAKAITGPNRQSWETSCHGMSKMRSSISWQFESLFILVIFLLITIG